MTTPHDLARLSSGSSNDPEATRPPRPQPHPFRSDQPGPRVLVIGATGYIGSRLVPRLLADGLEVSVLARTPKRLDDVPWRDEVTIHEGGLGDYDALLTALRGADVACHLVHSMGDAKDYAREERETTKAFVQAAEEAGIERIVHLSGLHPEDESALSPHLRSRAEVAQIMLASSVPALVIQAGVVIGSGSASFEMIRHLTTRLPGMVTPRWVKNRIQPIAVRDVIHYLAAAVSCPAESCLADGGRTIDVGGPDVLTYGEMMQVYAEEAGLRKRLMVPVPVLTPKLSSLWMGLVTPLDPGLAAPLVESLRCEAIVLVDDADEVLGPPPGGRTSYREALREALRVPHGPARPPLWDGADPLDDPARLLPSDADWAGVRPPTIGRVRSGR
ncbi:NAD(P)H-binding protein [Dietzia sp. ANT_WB102]|uniref:NAD(P)H-binding protein n=1 Tax=Dietzia sp. ANT_WB102 TaxID=2597345 RepID=UPI0011F04EFA|nr:NAD(P)H-binding protein [Dietzia sp. ANT_WB102]KAA0919130.1 NAD-dependent epimerase/dehydratase family protein [Dietzia sp. ANT_WB102]